jgi:cell wall-associated NlpC family hydrolase
LVPGSVESFPEARHVSFPHARSAARSLACVVALGVGLSSIGAARAAAAPSARLSVASLATASKPKPKKAHRRSSSGRNERTPKRSRSEQSSASAEMRELATIPTIVQLPVLDAVWQNGSAPSESLASFPVVPAPSAAVDGRPFSKFSASAEWLLSSLIERARSQLGTRYVFGGTKPGQALDCSAFARFAMQALGISLPRTAAQQARLGTPVPRDRTLLRPGDLLTFGRGSRVSHVGIYLGEGRFIHASVTSGRIIETTIERNGRLFRRWQGARRLMATGDSSTTLAGEG